MDISRTRRGEAFDRSHYTRSDLRVELSRVFQCTRRPNDLPAHPRPSSRLTSSCEMPLASRASRRASESPPSASSASRSSSKGAVSRARSTGSDVARRPSRTRAATGRSCSGKSSISRCSAFLPPIVASTSCADSCPSKGAPDDLGYQTERRSSPRTERRYDDVGVEDGSPRRRRWKWGCEIYPALLKPASPAARPGFFLGIRPAACNWRRAAITESGERATRKEKAYGQHRR